MKITPRVKRRFYKVETPWLRFLLYWKAALATGFDNRVWRALSGRSLYDLGGRDGRILPTKPQQVLLDGKVERWETFFMCRDVIVDFGRCRPVSAQSSLRSFFEEGFIRIGDRVSPVFEGEFPRLEFDQWQRTHEPAPAATEFAPGKTVLFLHYYRHNIAEEIRHLAHCQHVFDRAGVLDGDELLLSLAHIRMCGEIQLIADNLFNAKKISGGVFLFRRMAFLLPNTAIVVSSGVFKKGVLPWMTGDTSAALRHRLLTAFDIEPRKRVRDVGRITLISRQDWQEPLSGCTSRPTRKSHLTRKISNEDEIVAALRECFPDVEVQKVALERLPIKEQLGLVHRTDVLIGMHGAGFGFCQMLPPNAGVLGLLPAYFMYRHWPKNFYTVLVNNQCHYQRWINLNPRREFSSDVHTRRWPRMQKHVFTPRRDFTEVPPSVVVRKVAILRRQIRKMANCPDAQRGPG